MMHVIKEKRKQLLFPRVGFKIIDNWDWGERKNKIGMEKSNQDSSRIKDVGGEEKAHCKY